MIGTYEEAAVRREQREHGKRMTMTIGRNNGRGKQQQASQPKGHEAFLKGLETSGARISLEKMSSGEVITGRIKTSDKYTVSVSVGEGDDVTTRVIFKHDISEFRALTPTPASDKEGEDLQ